MNNQQFRRLVLDTPARPNDGAASTPRPSATPATLGSRLRANIPMTPRTVAGSGNVDFARQLAEQRAAGQPQKKFRNTAAPKGTKLATGYTDRARTRAEREEEEDADDKARRIQALEESMKLGQIERETFEQLRDSITGGDISSTHLVKGLDRKLLERVRRGEDVYKGGPGSTQDREPEPDLDEEFEKLEQKEVVPVTREKVAKKGDMAPPPPPVAGVKRTRAQVIADMKAERQAAAAAKAAAQPRLDPRFHRIDEKKERTRIERDGRGREVLIVVDEDGNEKRKVRKVQPAEDSRSKELLMPDKDAIPLGMDVPSIPTPAVPEEEDDDIFEGVGTDYNPLAGLGSEDDSSDSESGEEDEAPRNSDKSIKKASGEEEDHEEEGNSIAADQRPLKSEETTSQQSAPRPRSYFNDNTPPVATEEARANPLEDPTIKAAIQRAAQKSSLAEGDGSGKDVDEETRLKRRAAMLAGQDRDLDDMDLGFGSSRLGDDDAEDGGRVKLAEWKGSGGGDGDDDAQERGEKGGGKRKRGPKKRKGDKDNAADVLKVMERQKAKK